MNSIKKRLVGATAVTAAAFGALAVSDAASAQPVTQEGLVNVNLTDISVQVPIGIAANICDVNVAVLVSELRDNSAVCDADASPTATVERGGGGGPTTQNGLVNVNAEDLQVQVPIGIAANICDVNVAVLVDQFLDTAAPCLSDADGTAIVTPA